MVQAVAVPVRVVAVLVSDHIGLRGMVKLSVPTVPTAPVTSSRGMTTRLAFTMPEPARRPVTVTLSPTTTSDRLKRVYCDTSTVKPVVVPVVAVPVRGTGVMGPKPRVKVKLVVPTDPTVPLTMCLNPPPLKPPPPPPWLPQPPPGP